MRLPLRPGSLLPTRTHISAALSCSAAAIRKSRSLSHCLGKKNAAVWRSTDFIIACLQKFRTIHEIRGQPLPAVLTDRFSQALEYAFAPCPAVSEGQFGAYIAHLLG
jgi:hypothetical protein